MVGLLLSACADNEPDAPVDPVNPQAAAGPDKDRVYPAHWESAYGEVLRLAEEIPGYGGHYYEDNVAYVYLKDPRAQDQTARTVLGSSVRESVRDVPEDVEILEGEYHALDLVRWHDALSQLLGTGIQGAWGVGLGLRYNRIQLFVSTGIDESLVNQQLRAHGIPLEAIDIAEREVPPELDQVPVRPPLKQQQYTLRSKAEPGSLHPGFEIIVERQIMGNTTCTLGPIIETSLQGLMAITAAHCTGHRTEANPKASMYQRVVQTNDEIGWGEGFTQSHMIPFAFPPFTKPANFGIDRIKNGCRFAPFGQVQLTEGEYQRVLGTSGFV